ncbi:hypothetical protein [Qipengyuania sphaerica]|uniref:hypothetical protein n=1 Tax=Qipengyuania sphaerica TaxID=2867243 RepID=UPI001C86C9C3|nr:hypothetical protein [Qipengyuania sphaerica]MBX7539463.1 hypothetical protein [Qipengyuania sphaerica]
MSHPIPLQTPGGFAPAYALGIDDGTGNLALVADSRPLPVQSALPAAPAPLEGWTGNDALVGPFTPASPAPVYCTLSGDWQGSVAVKRSTDGGTTLHPLTVAGDAWGAYSSNACEPVWEESESGATLWLDCRIASGTLTYRLAQ